MPKKPKRSRHRIPVLTVTSDPITPEYQAEVDRATADLEKRYAKAQKALQRAEEKRFRVAAQEQRAAENKARAEAVAANRAENERLLTQRIAEIKAAAQQSRVTATLRELERQHADFVRRRAEQALQRKAELRRAREQHQLQVLARRQLLALEGVVEDRQREVKEIERLMMPGNYSGHSHRSGGVRHQTGAAS